MQKHILLFIVSLAFIFGCGRKEKEAAPLMQIPATTSAPKPMETQASDQAPKHPPLQSELKLQTDSAIAPDPERLAIGEKVYKGTCSICHKTGLNGAPRMGSKKDWEHRLAQGKEILYGRAINGYRGDKGSMPSRGSNPRLSEAEVKAAVDYIVEHSIPVWSVD